MGCGCSSDAMPPGKNPNRYAKFGKKGDGRSDKPEDFEMLKLEIQKKALDMLARPNIDIVYSVKGSSASASGGGGEGLGDNNTVASSATSSAGDTTSSSSDHSTDGGKGSEIEKRKSKIESRKFAKQMAEADQSWLILNNSNIYPTSALDGSNTLMSIMLGNIGEIASLSQSNKDKVTETASTTPNNTESTPESSDDINNNSNSNKSSSNNDYSNISNNSNNSNSRPTYLKIKDAKDLLQIVTIDALAFESSKADKIQSSATYIASSEEVDIPSGDVCADTVNFIISTYKTGKVLSIKSVHKLLRLGYKLIKSLPNVNQVAITEQQKLTVVGDIHGQLPDLLHILNDAGLPSAQHFIIFNGDFVDRGIFGVEVVCVLLSLLLAFPDRVFLNRGNHEDFPICCAYGFQSECFNKYDDVTFGMFVEVFSYIPLFAVVNNEVFVVHGGLFHAEDATIAELNQINRYNFSLRDIPETGESLEAIDRNERFDDFLKQIHRDALWSDPRDIESKEHSFRGAGLTFGREVTKTFLDTNKLNMVVRSHECVHSGFDQPFQFAREYTNLLCTIFSASNYSNGGNSAAYMTFFMDSSPFSIDVAKSLLHEVPASKQKLVYLVHTYYITPDEYPDLAVFYDVGDGGMDDNASVSSDGTIPFGAPESMELLSIRDVINKRGKVIMDQFISADEKKMGTIPVVILADILAHTLKLNINFLSLLPLLVTDDCYEDLITGDPDNQKIIEGIKYEEFIKCICTDLDRQSLERRDRDSAQNAKLDHNSSDLLNAANQASSEAVNLIMSPERQKPTSTSEEVSSLLQQDGPNEVFLKSMYPRYADLLSIFLFLDANGDGFISAAEFKSRCSLVPAARLLISDETYSAVFDVLDIKKDGLVDINAFFEMSRIASLDAIKSGQK